MTIVMRADVRYPVVSRSVIDSRQGQREFNGLRWGSVHTISTLVGDFGQMCLRSSPQKPANGREE